VLDPGDRLAAFRNGCNTDFGLQERFGISWEGAQPIGVSRRILLHAADLVSADHTTFILRTISCVCRQESQNTHHIETKQTLTVVSALLTSLWRG